MLWNKAIFTALLAVSFVLPPTGSADLVKESPDYPKTALQAVTTTFDSVQNADINGFVENIVDEVFTDPVIQKQEYIRQFSETPLNDYKLLSLKQVSEEVYIAEMELHYESVGDIPAIPYQVVKKGDRWKVLIEPIEINLIQGSPDYGEISKMDLVENAGLSRTSTISPQASVDTYSFQLAAGKSVYGQDSFYVTNPSTVTLSGYQDAI
ncbi:hypothetical protein [Gorillibacterium sp. CAU 1737]|uniref:hypothetical protein n=1 Tax=Gorillibacterium sp. CAU 1737 TaxID=3140362 RepID=UPI0032608A89